MTQNDVLDDDEDEPLNENDDDDDLDDVDQGEELNTQHLVLAQFDKVHCAHNTQIYMGSNQIQTTLRIKTAQIVDFIG